MHRLVVALTTLLALIGIAVVAAYLFVFGPGTDRAATMVPEQAVAYVTLSLDPSTGQETGLADLLTRLPGFSDRAALGDKIDQIVQRALDAQGLDYHADVRPWIGDQLALAVLPGAGGDAAGPTGNVVLLAAVRDEAAAKAAIPRIAARLRASIGSSSYDGIEVTTLSGAAPASVSRVAILSGMLVAAPDDAAMHAVIDVAHGHAGPLASEGHFRGAVRRLPADRLGTVYLNLTGVALASGTSGLASGYSAAALALVARADGLQLTGVAPFDAGAASASARAGFAATSQPATLPEWMPESTELELVFYGARQAFDGVVAQLGNVPGGADAAAALTQLRAIVALGLGIDFDRDLLPMFDREAAVALQGLDGSTPRGQLLLRPTDPAAAQQALTRVVTALRAAGSTVEQVTRSGAEITQVAVPQVGRVAYAVVDGVVVLALSTDDVAAALDAHASGRTLAASEAYRAAFTAAGGRGGNELFVAGARAAGLVAGLLGQSIDALPADVRDILTHVGAVAITVPSRQDAIEIHATVTVD